MSEDKKKLLDALKKTLDEWHADGIAGWESRESLEKYKEARRIYEEMLKADARGHVNARARRVKREEGGEAVSICSREHPVKRKYTVKSVIKGLGWVLKAALRLGGKKGE